ncbi:MAG TPA: glycosyltransferase [Longimicrobiaceae bacterium]|nr:glycosyltransferase [Longimicrobiaceae bacterium]
MTGAMEAPRISVVTPSFNQAGYLEHTLRSVLDQRYENLEYVVVDGGSTDGSVEILERYADRLAWWVSEPDGGHTDALNKGFAHTTGEIMAWLNSDDLHLPWTFQVVAEIFTRFPQVEWIVGVASAWDSRGRLMSATPYRKNIHDYLFGDYAWIQQESVFWRRRLWERAGGALDPAYALAADGELWSRFFLHAPLYSVDRVIGGFRHHGSNRGKLNFRRYVEELRRAIAAMRAQASEEVLAENRQLARLRSLYRGFPLARLQRRLVRRHGERLSRAGYDVIGAAGDSWALHREPFRLGR